MSTDKYNIPCRWDPFLSIPNEKEFKRISDGDIFLVDLDIMPNSSFLREIADFSGVERHPCINVISECTYPRTILDLGCKYLGFRVGYKHSDGIVSVESQESLSKNYPIVGKVYINASHANSLKRLLLASKKSILLSKKDFVPEWKKFPVLAHFLSKNY